jgi:hypothetical protein
MLNPGLPRIRPEDADRDEVVPMTVQRRAGNSTFGPILMMIALGIGRVSFPPSIETQIAIRVDAAPHNHDHIDQIPIARRQAISSSLCEVLKLLNWS